MAKISVIIPTYNSELTIESVQKQTLSDFEIIVINDGSNPLIRREAIESVGKFDDELRYSEE